MSGWDGLEWFVGCKDMEMSVRIEKRQRHRRDFICETLDQGGNAKSQEALLFSKWLHCMHNSSNSPPPPPHTCHYSNSILCTIHLPIIHQYLTSTHTSYHFLSPIRPSPAMNKSIKNQSAKVTTRVAKGIPTGRTQYQSRSDIRSEYGIELEWRG